jgi:hypothetical protein
MSPHIVADGLGGFRLYRGGEQVGWIAGGAIAFLGFESADEAARAAGTAYNALRAWFARQRRTTFVRGDRRALRARRRGDRTVLTLGGVTVGRVIEPADRARPGAGYGFELLLPPWLERAMAVGAADVIDFALAGRAAVPRVERQAAVA